MSQTEANNEAVDVATLIVPALNILRAIENNVYFDVNKVPIATNNLMRLLEKFLK